jgi:predicted nucleic acid-binding protein
MIMTLRLFDEQAEALRRCCDGRRRVSRRRSLGDTDILIRVERLSAEHLPTELLTSAVTLAELSAGVHQTDEAAECGSRIARRNESRQLRPASFDAEAARQYGAISAGVVAIGAQPAAARRRPDDSRR